MEFCCPSPENPVIQPNPQSLKYRRWLRYLYYGTIAECFVRILLFGLMSGIFNVFDVWMIYLSWSTMHFCNLIFFMVFQVLDLLMILSNFSSMQHALSNYPFLSLLLYGELLYLIISLYVSYKSFRCFKDMFDVQHGRMG